MNEVNIWWAIAAVFAALELVTGTLFAALTGVGAAIAAILAQVGYSEHRQVLAAALISAVLVEARRRNLVRRHLARIDDYRQSGVTLLDLGDEVHVETWNQDGTTQIWLHGLQWQARYRGTHVPLEGAHRIAAVEPQCLVLEAV